jgi:hypothetical protein
MRRTALGEDFHIMALAGKMVQYGQQQARQEPAGLVVVESTLPIISQLIWVAWGSSKALGSGHLPVCGLKGQRLPKAGQFHRMPLAERI